MASSNTTIPSTESTSAPATTSTPLTSETTSAVESTSSPADITTTTSAPPTTSEAPTSTPPPTTDTPAPTSTPAPSSESAVTTSTISQSSVPPTTVVQTSVVTQSPTGTDTTPQTTVIVITSTQPGSTVPASTTTSSSSSSTSTPATLNSQNGGDGSNKGLSTAGTTAVAVVVPVVVVALLVVAGIFFWRRRKQKKAAEEARRVEVEDYGFNPNNDPTLPVVASESGHEMAEDSSNGYRGWGAAGAAGTASRKMSTTLSGGHTQGQLSDAGSNAYPSRTSPNLGTSADGHSGDALMQQRRETMNSDDIGALGAAPLAGANAAGVRRGPSNASSTYSAAGHTDISDDGPGSTGVPQQYEAYNPNSGYGYTQHGPYGDGSYGGTGQDGMPIVRDVTARRNTRIQQAGNYQQGGIAQNF